MVRGPAGHGEDIRPALAASRTGGRAGLPLVVAGRAGVQLAAYGRADERRLLGTRANRTTRSIWPASVAAGDPSTVVLLLRGAQEGTCGWRRVVTPDDVNRCLPDSLRGKGYAVETAQPAGRRWTFAVLTRRAR